MGNSSVGVREAGYLGVPVVNIGSRQAGRERARNVVECSYDADEIQGNIQSQINHGRYEAHALYGDGTAGEKIAQILATVPLHADKQFFDGNS